jgi:23S rRNA (guanosine2251-2'-O)-methyltransferase
MVLETGEGGSLSEILELAGSKDLDARTSTRNEFDRLFPHQNHQGVAASYRPSAARNFEDLILGSGKASTLLLLDGVEDPQNLGAIIRTAEILGAAGVAIPERRAAGVTPAVVKASAGAALRLSPTLIGNLAQNIERAKQAGYWIYGLDPNGEKSIWEEEFPERILIVMGGEGKGLARLTRSLCDRLLRIPQAGRIGSLNVSAATAIVLAEVLRQRQKRGDAFDLP